MKHDDKCPQRAYENWKTCYMCGLIYAVRHDEREETLAAVLDVIDAAEGTDAFSRNALRFYVMYIAGNR